jgi:hypothetical protein
VRHGVSVFSVRSVAHHVFRRDSHGRLYGLPHEPNRAIARRPTERDNYLCGNELTPGGAR